MVIACHANPRVSHQLAKPHGELGDGSNSDTCLKFWMLYWQTSLAIFNHPNSPVSWVSILKKTKAIYCRNWSSLRVDLEVADMVSSVLLVNPLICFSIELPHFLGQLGVFFLPRFLQIGVPQDPWVSYWKELIRDDFWVLHFWRNLTLLLINIYIYPVVSTLHSQNSCVLTNENPIYLLVQSPWFNHHLFQPEHDLGHNIYTQYSQIVLFPGDH